MSLSSEMVAGAGDEMGDEAVAGDDGREGEECESDES